MTQRIITRTVTGSMLQTERSLGLKHNVYDFTTLNQAISERTIIANLPNPITLGMEVLPSYDYQTDSDQIFTKYIVIGNGGHKNITGSSGSGANGIPYTLPIPHLASDTGLYNPFPLVGRKVTADLTIAERRRYCLRRTIWLNGELWAFYFGLVLDYARVTPTVNITYVVDGQESTIEYVPTMQNLRPTPPTEDVTYDGSYADVTAPVQIVWNESQIQDIKDACRVLYGTENVAIISEIAICSGVTKTVTHKYPNSGTQTPIALAANTFFETVACQVVLYISTYVPIAFADREYKLELDLGATEPLFGVNAR